MNVTKLGRATIPPFVLPPEECTTLICFEENHAGFEAAAKFIDENGIEGVFRVRPSGQVEALTEASFTEFDEQATALHRALLTRSIKTGLTAVGEYMLALVRKGLDEDAVLGAASRHLRISAREAKQQYKTLCYGWFPRVEHPDMENWPHAFVNGPFPIAPELLKEAITKKINTRGFRFVDPAPSCPGHIFTAEDGGWVSDYVVNSDGTKSWPYNTLPEEMEADIDVLWGPAGPESSEAFAVKV